MKKFYIISFILVVLAVFSFFPVKAYAAPQTDIYRETVEEEKEEETVISVEDILGGILSEVEWRDLAKYIKYIEGQDTVPLYDQTDYPYTPYGNYGTIASHGCGITCLSMVATYLTDDVSLTPEALAEQFGHYNTAHGSYLILFEDSAEVLGLPFQERTYSERDVIEALANGQVVVALQSRGLFTSGGHFIVLTGINEEGLITVNDPNGRNYRKSQTMIDGFANGFTLEQVFENGGPYWIYEKKSVPNIKIEGDTSVLRKLLDSDLRLDNSLRDERDGLFDLSPFERVNSEEEYLRIYPHLPDCKENTVSLGN